MKNTGVKILLLLAGICLEAVYPSATAHDRTEWQIDTARSPAEFSVRYLVLQHLVGSFSNISGTVTIDERNPEALRVTATIDASSIDTNNRARDADLRGPNYLDVARFPQMTFVSSSTRVAPGG